MFKQPPKFFDAGDVINLNGVNTPSAKPKENKIKVVQKEESIIVKEVQTPIVEPKPSRIRSEKDFVFKYAGDDIPWII